MSAWLATLPPGFDFGLLALVAVLAGVINAIAGGGSLLILPLLVSVGLPPTVANGTLRIAIVVQATIATATFHRRGKGEIPAALRMAPPVIVGAAFGTWLATQLPDESMRVVFGVLLVFWAVVLLLRPDRFLATESTPKQPTLLVHGLGLVVGIYGGFLQAGVGFPLLALIVIGLGRTTINANAIKSAVVVAYSTVSLALFIRADQVAWREGLALAAGSAVGGWLGARWQLHAGVALVRWVLVVAVAVSAAAMFLP